MGKFFGIMRSKGMPDGILKVSGRGGVAHRSPRRRRRVRVLGAARHGAPEAELPHRRQPGKGAAGREVKF